MKSPAPTVRAVGPGKEGQSKTPPVSTRSRPVPASLIRAELARRDRRCPAASPLSHDGSLAYARVICGVRVGPECLPPEIERECIEAFRKLAARFDYLAGNPAFAYEAAVEYHRDRGGQVLVTDVRRKDAA